MPINPVNKLPKESAFDKIAKGMQIVQGISSLYGDYQKSRANSLQADAAENAQKGIYTPADATKAGLEFTPKPDEPKPTEWHAPLMPGAEKTSLVPPKERFSKVATAQGSMIGPEGALIPGSYRSREAVKDAEGNERDLRDKYNARPVIQNLDQAEQNYKNVELGFSRGDKEGDVAAVQNWVKLFSPGTRVTGGAGGGDTVGEIAEKYINKLMGGKNVVLTDPERAAMKNMADKAIYGYVQNAQSTIDEFKGHADAAGVQHERVGIHDYSQYTPLDQVPGGLDDDEMKAQAQKRTGKTGKTGKAPSNYAKYLESQKRK